MVSRYTSAALSRALRDAGVSQEGEERCWFLPFVDDPLDPPRLGWMSQTYSPEHSSVARALRLDEVIEELVALGVRPWLSPARDGGWIVEDGDTDHDGKTPTEAAGLLLLAVLKGRKP